MGIFFKTQHAFVSFINHKNVIPHVSTAQIRLLV